MNKTAILKKQSVILFIIIALFSLVFTRCKTTNFCRQDFFITYLDSIYPFINLSNDTIGFLSVYNINRNQDSLISVFPDYIKNEDNKYWGVVGRFIDTTNLFALIINPNDSTVNFYSHRNNRWKKIGTDKPDVDYISGVSFYDMDGDNRNEIISITYPNMNGNIFPLVYYHSMELDSIRYAGRFETEFIVKKYEKRLETNYEGSWWMPHFKTIYLWRNEKLVPIKRIQLTYKEDSISFSNSYSAIEYYENPTYDKDSLKLIFRNEYNNEGLYNDLYNHFFEEN